MNSVVQGPVARAVPAMERAPGEAPPGLLTDEEVVATLRRVLGDAVPEARLAAAAAALQEAEAAQWEALPANISEDMGFNYFVVCRETCWLAREILLFGSTFRVFRQRSVEPIAGSGA